ncbi:acyl-CoA carboxylase subunit epsilon [Kitasatospora sp. NPDC101183]|uniref:acyl-CoA carboxylase subunit epsilon n=1 Tax=Kitasatospora sp. NPDC101183 TaxID=3364100 RepID=UPI003803F7E1
MNQTTETLFTIEHGRPSPEELAVVTAVLLSRLRGQRPGSDELSRAGWTVTRLDQAGSWAGPDATVWRTAV